MELIELNSGNKLGRFTTFECKENDYSLEDVDIYGIIKELDYPEENNYFIDRILTIGKIYSVSEWRCHPSRGYYDEYHASYEVLTSAPELDTKIRKVVKLPLKKKIEYVLELEYGYLLSGLEKREWTPRMIVRSDIVFGDIGHYNKLEPAILKKYKDYPYPRGILIEVGQQLRIIDGYHRLAASPPLKSFMAFVGTL